MRAAPRPAESMAIDVLRRMMRVVFNERIVKVTVTVEEAVATYLNNRKRRELAKLERLAIETLDVEPLLLEEARGLGVEDRAGQARFGGTAVLRSGACAGG